MNDISKQYSDLLKENERLRKVCEKTLSTSMIYTHIAHALTRDYTDLFYVNMDTDEYIEFHTNDVHGVLVQSRQGSDFFESCSREAKLFVHPDDQKAFISAMNREFLTRVLNESEVYTMTYRRIKNGRMFWVQMKVTRMTDDKRIIILATYDIDELVKKRQEEDRIQEERTVYARLHAITGNFIVVYVVDPKTNHYREFSSTANYSENYTQAKEGENFFETVRERAVMSVYPADQSRFLAVFSKETILDNVERSGIFSIGYRFMMNGKPLHVQMKAAMVEEKEGSRLIVGLNDIDEQVRQEEEIEKRLIQAESQANIDALTGVKNKHAYLEAEARLDRQIFKNRVSPFAIVMMDLNDLKKINDTAGHQAGDQYLRDACKIICNIFKHSPVFRIGGDEFAVIVQGNDYSRLEERIEEMRAHNIEALQTNGIVIACGMALFENDTCAATVLERADHAMYKNKADLKAMK